MKSMRSAGAFKDALPIMTAYVPIAITFGVVSMNSGLSWLQTILISVVVYAGGAQFMLVGFVAAGVSPVSTMVSVLLVNLRHILYGTTIGPALSNWSEGHRWLNAFGLTDEVFALTGHRMQAVEPEPAYQHMFVFSCYASWVLGTLIGVGIGRAVPASWSNVLGFALPALFLALLLIGGRTLAYLLAAFVGAGCAILLNLLGMGSVGTVVGAVAGASIGLLCDVVRTRRIQTQQNVSA